MTRRNMSDIIESYLKSYLSQDDTVEIKRSDIAEHFDCVPSQINYVINTRFTLEHGYMVESKRGGGGYIRIFKIEMADQVDHVDHMLELIGNRITERNALNMVHTLTEEGIMTEREGAMILSLMDRQLLQTFTQDEQILRAQLLKSILQHFRINY